jgi:hypothetical protein
MNELTYMSYVCHYGLALKHGLHVSFVQLKMGQSVIYETNMYIMYVLPYRGESMLEHSIY